MKKQIKKTRVKSPHQQTATEKPYNFLFYSLLAAATLLYCLLNAQYRTGVINDDAVFVLGARSLLAKASFQSLVIKPDYPMPGLPLLLAPWAKLVAPNWISLEWSAVLASVVSVYLLGLLAQKLPSRGQSLAVIALFAFNPIVAQFSGIIMPASFYTAALIGSFLLMDELLQKPTIQKGLALGALLGWASLIRPEGILLLLCIAVTLAITEKGRELLHVIAAPIILWALFFVYWWRLQKAPQTEYGGDLAGLTSYWIHHAFSGMAFIGVMLHDLFIRTLLGFTLPAQPVFYLAIALIVLFCVTAVVEGYRRLWEENVYERPVLLAAAFFCGMYSLVHLFWHVAQPRYEIPLLPFILVFLVHGIHALTAPFNQRKLAARTVLVLVLVCYAYKNGIAAYETIWTPDPMKSPPWRSLSWLDHNTPANVNIVSNIAPNVELYANRPALSGLKASNFEMLLYRLKRRKLKYIVQRKETFLSSGVDGTEDPNASWAHLQLWASHYPKQFPLVFEDGNEQTKVFHVAHKHGFRKAYKVFKTAYKQYQANNLDEAFRLVNDSLTLYPQQGSANNLLGAIYMKRNDAKNAERAFLKTTQFLPDATNALVNLATLYHMLGQEERSREYIQRALAVSAGNGDRDVWSQKIEELQHEWEHHETLIFMDKP